METSSSLRRPYPEGMGCQHNRHFFLIRRVSVAKGCFSRRALLGPPALTCGPVSHQICWASWSQHVQEVSRSHGASHSREMLGDLVVVVRKDRGGLKATKMVSLLGLLMPDS